MNVLQVGIWVSAMLVLSSAPVSAQDARLAQLERGLRGQITSIVEEADAQGLPTEPLIQKTLEGVRKGARPDQVTAAVHALSKRLALAARTLGSDASEAELSAAASAIYVGVEPAQLTRIRAARSKGSVAMPLAALAFFIQQGAAREQAVAWVQSIVQLDVPNSEILRLQQTIEQDARTGASRAAATATRVQALLRTFGGTIK